MWITTHPFAQTTFSKLTEESSVAEACAHETHKPRLGGQDYDSDLGELLSLRLWLVVVNDRMLDEMIMGDELRAAVLRRWSRWGPPDDSSVCC